MGLRIYNLDSLHPLLYLLTYSTICFNLLLGHLNDCLDFNLAVEGTMMPNENGKYVFSILHFSRICPFCHEISTAVHERHSNVWIRGTELLWNCRKECFLSMRPRGEAFETPGDFRRFFNRAHLILLSRAGSLLHQEVSFEQAMALGDT